MERARSLQDVAKLALCQFTWAITHNPLTICMVKGHLALPLTNVTGVTRGREQPISKAWHLSKTKQMTWNNYLAIKKTKLILYLLLYNVINLQYSLVKYLQVGNETIRALIKLGLIPV